MSRNKKIDSAQGAHRRAVVFVIVLSSFLPSFAGSVVNVAVPVIGQEFHSSATALGWIVSSFIIATVAFMLPLGRLADLTSRRIILVAGLLLFSLMSGATFLVTDMPLLIVLRVVQGIGSAGMFATCQAILVDAVPKEERGKVLGMSIASVYIGLSAGPVLGGFITQHLGWRWIFVFVAVLGIVTAIAAIVKLPEKPSAEQLAGRNPELEQGAAPKPGILSQLDGGGIALYMVAMTAIIYGFNTFLQNWQSYVILGAGVLLFIGFIVLETKVSTPLIKIAPFREQPRFLLSNLAALLNYSATFAVGYLLSIYLQLVKGFGADQAGLILITMPLIQAVITVFAGRMSDKRSPFLLASIGMALCAAGLVSFIFVGEGSTMVHILATLCIVGVGFGFFSSPNTNAIMSFAPPQDYGIVASLIGTMRQLGMSVSMCIITIIMNISLGATPIAEATKAGITHTMRISFIVFAVICVVGVFFSFQKKAE
jgi:MFS family permease